MGLVFINYRVKERSLGPAAIYRELAAFFGPHQVFQDQVSLRPGQKYPTEIRHALARADLLVAVIGPDWLTMTDERGVRLLDRQDDWVRHELVVAFTRGVTVIPVLLNGTAAPAPDQLPADLRQLASAQAIEIDGRRLDEGLTKLIDACRAAGLRQPPLPASQVDRARRPAWWRRSRWLGSVAGAVLAIAGSILVALHQWSDPGRTSPGSTPRHSDSAVRYDGPISVQNGADLDQLPPLQNPVGDIRIEVPTQFDPGPGAAIVPWDATPAPDHDDCRRLLTGALTDLPVFDPDVGDFLCVRTSEGRTARLRSTGLSGGGAFRFDVIVWES